MDKRTGELHDNRRYGGDRYEAAHRSVAENILSFPGTDNAPVFQMETDEKYFSFIVKTDFAESHHWFDQCGIMMYLDSENWLKGSIEYENEEYQHLGSVVTNEGYSDWATTVIAADVKSDVVSLQPQRG